MEEKRITTIGLSRMGRKNRAKPPLYGRLEGNSKDKSEKGRLTGG